MFPEFFQTSSRIPLFSSPLTGEFAETVINTFVLYFISFILLKYFLNFSGQNFVTGANRSRILQEFLTELRFQKQQASTKGWV